MRKIINLFFILVFIIFSKQSFARYRAYTYEIKDTTNGEIVEVTTTLAPEVYLTYYEANQSFRTIKVVSTWMCWGDTSHYKAICSDPRSEEVEEVEE